MHTQTFVEIEEGIIVEMSGRICKYSAGMMINRDFGMEHQNFEVHDFNSRNDLGGGVWMNLDQFYIFLSMKFFRV